jgi:hypothetical protein
MFFVGLLWLCRPRGDRPAIRGEFIKTIVGVTVTAGLAVGFILALFGIVN